MHDDNSLITTDLRFSLKRILFAAIETVNLSFKYKYFIYLYKKIQLIKWN